jgi:hypothetical protein
MTTATMHGPGTAPDPRAGVGRDVHPVRPVPDRRVPGMGATLVPGTCRCSIRHWHGAGGGMCVHAETCGSQLGLEHTCDLYSCDHYAAQDSRRGRNDPCPCGSNRKWKRCHGAIIGPLAANPLYPVLLARCAPAAASVKTIPAGWPSASPGSSSSPGPWSSIRANPLRDAGAVVPAYRDPDYPWLSAGPMFQARRPAPVAGCGVGSSQDLRAKVVTATEGPAAAHCRLP